MKYSIIIIITILFLNLACKEWWGKAEEKNVKFILTDSLLIKTLTEYIETCKIKPDQFYVDLVFESDGIKDVWYMEYSNFYISDKNLPFAYTTLGDYLILFDSNMRKYIATEGLQNILNEELNKRKIKFDFTIKHPPAWKLEKCRNKYLIVREKENIPKETLQCE